MSKLVCFGEIMLRLNPPGYLRFVQADSFQASYAGGEANVAVAASCLGLDAAFVTKLPDNEIGQSAINALRRYGVDTSRILRGGERIGIYFVEKGASQRASKVIYDRKDSAVSLADPAEYDWKNIFAGAGWFHFTGITPALSDLAARACLDACKEAKRLGLIVSCDLNYRGKLWSREKARAVMSELMPFVDVCIANEEDASDVFGIRPADTDVTSGKLSREGYEQVAREISARFGCNQVAITLRKSVSASDNDWAGMLFDGTNCAFSKTYPIRIVDRVGGGDSFGGGLIYALKSGMGTQEAIEFAVAASCLKQTIENDYSLVSVAEVKKLAQGDGSGRVQR
ncbi:MAG TPA: sugar kinase [Feifaniaceae bacterium]|nr:sugar kinase [Feifaniaceae bacterium]